MSKRSAFISLALNCFLLGAIFFVRYPGKNVVGEPDIKPSVTVPHLIRNVTRRTNMVQQAASMPFDWSQVESEDFLAYANNLRGIGCPEATVRDILTAEINDLFVHRRQDLFRPFQSQIWDLVAHGDLNLRNLVFEKAEALDEQKEALLKKVFSAEPPEKGSFPTSQYESVMGDTLSPEKVRKLHEISEKFGQLRQKLEATDLGLYILQTHGRPMSKGMV